MFLNDAFDATFDRQYRTERPIPSGAVKERTVWLCGWACIALGVAALFCTGIITGILSVFLAGCIIFYDAVHKRISFAPVLMGACRFLLYLVAASSCSQSINGWAVWCGLALACYIIGLSYLARRESTAGALQYWPLLFLAFPILLALIMNANEYRDAALFLSAVVSVWIIKSLRYTLWSPDRAIGRTVSSLLAGIVLVDWLAVPHLPKPFEFIFIGLFLLALLFQRFIPAT
jgi:4-hydroxybenzoate polyprenyltransferase